MLLPPTPTVREAHARSVTQSSAQTQIYDAIAQADVTVLLVDHAAFRSIDRASLEGKKVVRFPPDRGGIGYKESHAREETQVR